MDTLMPESPKPQKAFLALQLYGELFGRGGRVEGQRGPSSLQTFFFAEVYPH